MALRSHLPTDPHAVLAPDLRWYPADDVLAAVAYGNLLPPLVHKVRQGVKAWRDSGYAGASTTTQALLRHWFQTEHLLPQADLPAAGQAGGTMAPFQYYFAQREAVESVVWLYEIEHARDPYALLKYGSRGRVSKGMFPEDWTRYVLKLATGAGKTNESRLDLGAVVREVPDLIVLNDEAHRTQDPDMAWFKNLSQLEPATFTHGKLALKQFTPEQQGEIVFKDKDEGGRKYHALFVRQEKWERSKPKCSSGLQATYQE